MTTKSQIFRMSAFDPGLFIAFIILTILGLIGLYTSDATGSFFFKQFLWTIIGIILFFIFLNINYSYYEKFAEYIYGVNMFLLIVTLLLGITMRNTRGWINFFGINFQFSETAKISLIFLLSKYLCNYSGKMNRFWDLLLSILLLLLPFTLIMIQPDMGTALVLLPIFFIIFYLSGVNDIFIIVISMASLLAVGLSLWMSYYQITDPESSFWLYRFFTNKILFAFLLLSILLIMIIFIIIQIFTGKRSFQKIIISLIVFILSLSFSTGLFHILKTYHKKRFLVFINPEIDRFGAGYNIIQSMISIGSGGMIGKGFMKGKQSLLGFLPAQNTDFIFSVLAEQFGFIFSLTVFAFFSFIILKGWNNVKYAKDKFGSLVSAGITTYIFIHVIINIGMATGLMPIIGLPLPFLSYGGSSLVTSMISIAILMNIQYNRFVNV